MLSDNEVRALVGRLMENSIGSVGSDARWDTTRLLDQYHGRPYGTEVDGRSKVVTREVLEQIEWAMPSLMRVLASGSRVAEFMPHSPEDVQAAEQESDYVNFVFLNDCKGWDVLNQWFRSALLERNAYVKVYWDTQRHTRVTSYEGLSEMQLAAVLQGWSSQVPTGYQFEAVEILEQATTIAVDEMTGAEYEAYDVKVREVSTRGVARVEYVPREEIRISKDAHSLCLDGVACVAHVRDISRSDLIEMGYPPDVVESLPGSESHDMASNTVTYSRETERSSQRTEYSAADEAGELVQVSEAYVRIDVDEDGITELRRVMMAGEHLLENEEVEEQPFVALCPIPQPATHIGMGLGDLVEDIQLIKTHLMRSILDNLALTNNPEKEVVWNNVEFPDDFAASVIGGLKRVTESGTVRELAVPFAAGASVPILELLDGMKEARTGISKNTMGMDADALSRSTLGAFSMGLEQANQRLEMITRTFAETGLTWLFSKLRGVLVRYQDMPRVVQFNGEFVEVDPRNWSDRTDVSVEVGLGTGRTMQTINYLQAIAQKQEQMLETGSPMVGPEELYNTYEKLAEVAGFKDASQFWAPPDSPQFQQRAQAAAQQAQEAQAMQQQAAQAQVQVAMADIQQRNDAAMARTQQQMQSDMAKLVQSMQQFMEENQRKWAEMELKYATDIIGKGVDRDQLTTPPREVN